MLAILTNISYLHSCFHLTDRIQTRASRIQSGHSKLHNIRTAGKSTTATSTESLISSADRPHNTQQPAMNSGGSSLRIFEKRLLRAITDRKLKSRRRPAAQTRIPTAYGTAQCKHTKAGGAKAIAMVQESIKPFSPPFIRKTAALIDQVAELVEQLNQVAIDEGSENLCGEKHETLGIPPPKVNGVASKDWF
ncbi:hypothetical protein NA56DRAFT_705526 [Hyaloscypha hepaticicola]|uniref:Uncharacterized protein n=1 Tax=Hyaloscypha hepaticicola TaxID=2082293 RepID=A0A2J6PZB0_9HELO|nr:hypothetical protein NA56DRAFT_705526 [Hyaloscypha hepaticicola]